MSLPNEHLLEIIDDLWVGAFVFLPVCDVLTIRVTCKHFHNLTNCEKSKGINQYFKHKCQLLCPTVSSSKFQTQKWYNVYKEIVTLAIHERCGYEKIQQHIQVTHEK